MGSRAMARTAADAGSSHAALAQAVAVSLKRYRERKGMTQQELAKLVGMKQPAIARLEAGQKTPGWQTLMKLARVMKLEVLVDINPRRGASLVTEEIASLAEVIEKSDDGILLVAVR